MTGWPSPLRPDGGTPEGSFFRLAPEPIIRYRSSDEPTVAAVNRAFESAFDTAAEKVEGRPLSAVLRGASVEGDQPTAAVDDLLGAITSGRRRSTELRLEPDSNPSQLRAEHVPLDDERGEGYVVLTDVTELRATIRELEAKAARLEEATKTVAHDIRNPLEVAEINLEVGRETGDEELLEKVAAAHEQIERLVEDVLTLAVEGRVIDERTATELDSVLSAAWSNVDTADAELVIEDSRVIEADEDRLRQLLENVVRNAIEHSDGAVTVRAGTLDDGFFVEDDGPGIPEAVRDQVFDQGFSADAGGSGLGLAIVERIAEAHGWNVSVTAGRDDGARFEVTGVTEVDAAG